MLVLLLGNCHDALSAIYDVAKFLFISQLKLFPYHDEKINPSETVNGHMYA